MVRPKKGVAAADRLQQLFNSPIFRLLKPDLPRLSTKVQLVSADLAEVSCGLAIADQELLVRLVPLLLVTSALQGRPYGVPVLNLKLSLRYPLPCMM